MFFLGPLTFIHWLYRDDRVTLIYLKTLIIYFKDVMKMDKNRKEEVVAFERYVANTAWRQSWQTTGCQKPILEVNVHLKGRIGDIEGQVEMDFANKNVGFGSSGSQEELLLGTSPETCVIVLFNETLEENETISITGARRYGTYAEYGWEAYFTGPCRENWNWNKRKILAIDAIRQPKLIIPHLTK